MHDVIKKSQVSNQQSQGWTKNNNQSDKRDIAMGRLANKSAVITGAAMGNGLGIASVFAKEGAKVAMLDRDDKVFDAAEEIQENGGKTYAYKVDICDKAVVKESISEIIAKQDKIDILVNNAGVAHVVPFLEMEDDVRNFVFNVNLNGTWNCTKTVVPYMVEKKYGKIVNLSSVTGPIVADVGQTAYATTKAGVWGFTKALAMELVEYDINVNMICPGMFKTPMVINEAKRFAPDSPNVVLDFIASKIPMKRLGEPEEIGYLAAFLASDEAAYITGQSFVIDGGSTLPETAGGTD